MSEDSLLLFQIKSHISRPDSAHNLARAQRKMHEGFRQFRTLIEAAESLTNTTLANLKGIEVPFNIRSFKSIYIICVVDLIQDPGAQPVHFRTTGHNDHEYPIFAVGFEARDLLFLLHQLDTIPDFTTYLSTLVVLETKFPISLEMTFLDLLAYIRLYPEELVEALESGKTPVHLIPGIAENMMDRLSEFEMEKSYLIDDIIDWLHQLVEMPHKQAEAISSKQDFSVNSTQPYWVVASKLANLPRNGRLGLARLIQEKRVDAQIDGYSYGIMVTGDRAFLTYFSASSQTDRIRELGGLCIAFLTEHSFVNDVVGLCFPTSGEWDYLCEAAFLKRDDVSDIDALKSKVREQNLFSPPRVIGN